MYYCNFLKNISCNCNLYDLIALQIRSLSAAVMGRLFTYQIFKYLNLYINLKLEALQISHLFWKRSIHNDLKSQIWIPWTPLRFCWNVEAKDWYSQGVPLCLMVSMAKLLTYISMGTNFITCLQTVKQLGFLLVSIDSNLKLQTILL